MKIPKIKKTERMWSIELTMLSTADPSIDDLEKTLTDNGFSEVTIKKTPLVVHEE